MPAESRADCNIQSQLLRRSAGCPGASKISGKAKAAPKTRGQGNLEAAFRRHLQLRTISGEKRCDRAEVLSPRFKERTKATLPGANRRSAEELEVLL